MFDQPGGDLQAHPLFVAKNVDLPLEGIARFAGAFLRRFQPAFACEMGVTRIIVNGVSCT